MLQLKYTSPAIGKKMFLCDKNEQVFERREIFALYHTTEK